MERHKDLLEYGEEVRKREGKHDEEVIMCINETSRNRREGSKKEIYNAHLSSIP